MPIIAGMLTKLTVLAGAMLSLYLAYQVPAPIASHIKALQSAKALVSTLQIQPLGGSPYSVKLTFVKPNLFRIDRPDGFTLSDGKTVYQYSKKSNTYTETPAADLDHVLAARQADIWAWSAFFDADQAKQFKLLKVGPERTLRGKRVTEVTFAFAEDRDGSGTLYIDRANAVAFGFSIRRAGVESLVFASEIATSADPSGLSFVFVPPAGATKAETLAPAATFAEVSAVMRGSCMPCHSTDRNSGGVQLTNYEGVAAIVTPGEPAASRLINSVKGIGVARMPKNRAPLSADTIALLEAWVKAGAKRD